MTERKGATEVEAKKHQGIAPKFIAIIFCTVPDEAQMAIRLVTRVACDLNLLLLSPSFWLLE